MEELETILQAHGLRKTTFRLELMELFHNAKSSLTVEEIRKRVSSTNDKVTVYRGLDAFEKNGIIHIVPDKNNLSRYALCETECSSAAHVHNHAHFICTSCDETFCINDVQIPRIDDTKDFVIKSSKLVLEGFCGQCAV